MKIQVVSYREVSDRPVRNGKFHFEQSHFYLSYEFIAIFYRKSTSNGYRGNCIRRTGGVFKAYIINSLKYIMAAANIIYT